MAANSDGVSLNEDAGSVTGNVATNDTPAGSSVTATTVIGVYGTLSLATDGVFTYTLGTNPSIQALGVGGTLTDTFNYTYNGGGGSTANLVVTITGLNDAPVPNSTNVHPATDTAAADSIASVTGALTAVDPEGHTLSWTGTSTGTYGTLTVATNGTYTYVYNNTAVNALADGANVTENYVTTVTDGTASSTKNVTITLTGANDTPIVTSTNSHTTTDTAGVDSPATVSANLTATDAEGNSLTWTGTSTGTYGTLTVATNGSYTFDYNDTAVNAVAGGATATENYTVTVSDGLGGTAAHTVSITINGANDTPAVTSVNSHSATDTAGVDSPATVTSNLTTNADAEGNTLTWTGTSTGTYGTLTVATNGSYTFDYNDTAVNGLGASTVTENYVVAVNDGSATTSHTVAITINGANDTPIVTSTNNHGATDTAGVDSPATVNGTLTATDAEGNSLSWTGTSTGTYGTLTVATNGTYSFDYNDTTVNALSANATENYTVTVSDGLGGTANHTVAIQLTGANDTPIVTSTNSHAATDTAGVDSPATASGTATATDAEGNTLTWSGTSTGTYGTLTMATDGSYTFDYNDAAVNGLSANATENYTVTVSDGAGGTANHTVAIQLTGANDTPIVTSTNSHAVADTAAFDSPATASGTATATDAEGNTLNWTGTSTGTYGTLTVATNGSYTFDYNDTALNALGAAAAVTENYTLNVSDGNGGTASHTVFITLTGANDGPAQTTVNTHILTDTTGPTTIVDFGGAIGATDPEGDSVSWTQSTQVGTYGTLVLATDGTYSFDVNDTAVDAVAGGSTATENFSVVATDGTATATHTITINVTGANDTPIVTSTNTHSAADTAGVDSPATASGTATATDAEGNTLTWSGTSTGTYGTLTMATDGSYTFDYNDTAVNALTAAATENYTVSVSDGNGGTASHTVSITLTGTNDTPVVTSTNAHSATDTAGVDSPATASGTATATDAEGNTLSWSGTSTGTYGTLTVASNGSYTFDYNDTAVNALGATTAVENYTISVSDGNGGTASHTVAITINGANDTPIVTSTNSHTATDTAAANSPATVSSNLTATDAEGNTLSWSGTSTGTYGTLTVASNGSYTFDYNDTAVNAVAGGVTATENYTVTVSDGLGGTASHTVAITINGANDTPIVTSTNTHSATDTAGVDSPATASGTATATDAEGNTLTWTGTSTGTYGTLTMATDGSYTFDYNDTAVNALTGAATENYTVSVSDGNGGTASHTVSITLTGTNDTPVVTSTNAHSATDTAGVDSPATASGTATATDAEGNTLSWSGTSTGTYGTLTVASNGSYTFDYNDTAVNALGATTAVENYTISVSDGNGGTASHTVAITINGANDTPIVTSTNSHTATDTAAANSPATVSSNLTATDAEGNTLSWSGTSTGTYGTLTVASNGSYTFDYNDTAVNAVAGGATATENYTVTVSDGLGGTASHTVAITINGANDTPIVTSTNTHSAADTAGVDSPATASGTATATDAEGNTLTWTGTSTGTYGTLTMATDGSYTFDYNDTAVNALAAAAAVTENYTVTVSDGLGGTAAHTVSITLTGANDTPIPTGVNSHTLVDTATNNTYPDQTGTLGATDAEGNALSWTQQTNVGTYGTLVVNSNGTYTYDVNDAAVNAVPAATNPTEGFTVTVSDGTASATHSITINVTGANDTPDAVNDTGAALEAGVDPGADATGNVLTNDTDRDNPDTQTVTGIAGGSVGSLRTGTYGDITLNSNGTYTYVVNNAHPTVNGLDDGETLAESFTYTLTDSAGGTDTAILTITITGQNDAPVANNDSASANESGYLFAGTFASGNVISNDVDADGDGLKVTLISGGVVNDEIVGIYGTLTIADDGAYVYVIDNTNPAVEALRVIGDTVSEAFTYTIADDNGTGDTASATLTITIRGRNDAPDAVADTGTALEAGTGAGSNATGNVLTNDTDVDAATNGETKTVSAISGGTLGSSLAGTYGSITLASDGTYTYVVNETNTSVQGLRVVGNTLTDGFTYTVIDTAGVTDTATITVTITGANDAPVANTDAATALEAGTSAGSNGTGNVLTNDTDVDFTSNGETKTVTVITGGTVGSALAGTYGSITLNSNGTYTYVINETHAGVQALRLASQTLTEAFTYTMADAVGATSSSTLTVTIQGANDAPVANTDAATAVETGTAAGSNGTGNVLANDTDVDAATNGESQTVSAIAGGTVGVARVGTYGTITLASDGTYTYVVAETNTSVQGLRTAAQTLSEAFTYTVSDTAGATATSTVTITIQGANDAPVANTDAATAVETGTSAGSNGAGNVLANDTDVDFTSNGETKTVTVITGGTVGAARVGTYGSITLNSDGTYTYVVNETNASVQGLRIASQTLTESFTYTMADTVGATSSSTLTVTIQGANDAPVANTDAATAVETGTAAGSNGTGNVLTNDTDVDFVSNGESQTVTAIGGGTVGSARVGTYGTITLGSNGTYTYVINETNASVQGLRTAAQTLAETFTYTMADTAGATSSSTLTVTIQGANDAPVGVADTGTAVETGTGTGASGPGSNATGNVLTNDTDVDFTSNGETKTVSAIAGGTVGLGRAGTYGTITLGSNGAYTYVVNETNASVQGLRIAGQTLTDGFTYTVVDTAGATATTTVTITIQGANDAPVGVDDTGGAVETGVGTGSSGPGSNATGNVLTNDTDVDFTSNGETKAVSGVSGGTVGAARVGSYGSITINSNGTYTYVVNNANATVNALELGETISETFTYTVQDAGGATDLADIVITITGANDSPVAVDNSASATESGTQSGTSAYGNAISNDTDVDNNYTHTASADTIAGDFGTLYITVGGDYTYDIDNLNETVDALAVGETLTETFSYQVNDEHGGSDIGTITITINGGNDAPIAVDDTAEATEAGTDDALAGVGNLLDNDTDVDLSDTHHVVMVDGVDFTLTDTFTYTFTSASSTFTSTSTSTYTTNTISVVGSYGTLDVTVEGDYQFNIDDLNATVNALSVSETLTETFSYTMADNHGATSMATLTVTIRGANDAPNAVDNMGDAMEAAGSSSGSDAYGNVLTNDTDPDNNSSISVGGVAGFSGAYSTTITLDYGWIFIEENGDYHFWVDNGDADVQALGPSETLVQSVSYTVVDEHGAIDVAMLQISIAGQNDAPVGTVEITGLGYAGFTLTANPNFGDVEGIASAFSYVWRADGVVVGGNASTYILTSADAGKMITVEVSYTDGGGTLETVVGARATATGLFIVGSQIVDRLVGSAGDDEINGLGSGDRMTGGFGNDLYHVDNARDQVIELAGQGIDTIMSSVAISTLAANVENAILLGTANLALKGNALANVLVGNDGNNSITGNGGNDTMEGGLGADQFIFSKFLAGGSLFAVINDFSTLERDKLNLKAIDAKEGVAGDQPFRFIGEAQFSDFATPIGLLRWNSATHSLEGSTDNDTAAEVIITLVGINGVGTGIDQIALASIVL